MKKRILIPILLVVAALAGGTALFLRKPSLRYLAANALTGIFSKNPLTEASPEELSRVSLSELLSMENVVFDQSMALINNDYPLSSDFAADVAEYGDTGVVMNVCVMEAYRALSADVRERFNEKLYIMSAYRTEEEQRDAVAEEGENAAMVGASEHQAGLSLDVYVPYYAGAGFLDSEVGQYINKNCQKFGFIIRYPYYGKDSTGIGFEPWHLRYVGYPHAEIIAENRLTLEEYLALLDESLFWQYENVLLTVQSGDELLLPADWESLTISPDNRGNYVVAAQMP